MGLLIGIALLIALIWGLHRAIRKWGWSVFCFFVAAVDFIFAAGTISAHLWGPRYGWRLGNGDPGSAVMQGIVFLILGFATSRKQLRVR